MNKTAFAVVACAALLAAGSVFAQDMAAGYGEAAPDDDATDKVGSDEERPDWVPDGFDPEDCELLSDGRVRCWVGASVTYHEGEVTIFEADIGLAGDYSSSDDTSIFVMLGLTYDPDNADFGRDEHGRVYAEPDGVHSTYVTVDIDIDGADTATDSETAGGISPPLPWVSGSGSTGTSSGTASDLQGPMDLIENIMYGVDSEEEREGLGDYEVDRPLYLNQMVHGTNRDDDQIDVPGGEVVRPSDHETILEMCREPLQCGYDAMVSYRELEDEEVIYPGSHTDEETQDAIEEQMALPEPTTYEHRYDPGDIYGLGTYPAEYDRR